MLILEKATDTFNNTDESQRSSPKCKKPDTLAYIIHDSIHIKCKPIYSLKKKEKEEADQ